MMIVSASPILFRQGARGYELFEVKSSSSIKDIYLDDLAYQYYVINNAGFPIEKASLMGAITMYRENYEKVRFHIEFGPPSLFERVRYKMKDVKNLYLSGKHFSNRVDEREIPIEILNKLTSFDIDEWTLRTAEVRKDRGKFINSTWEYCFNGASYWITIGIGNFIKTIVRRDSSGVEKCLRGGEFYDYVEQVNRELMDAETDVAFYKT